MILQGCSFEEKSVVSSNYTNASEKHACRAKIFDKRQKKKSLQKKERKKRTLQIQVQTFILKSDLKVSGSKIIYFCVE